MNKLNLLDYSRGFEPNMSVRKLSVVPLDHPLKVVDEGYTIIGEGGENPIADIVLIHGLGGHPRTTWSTSGHVPRPSRKPKLETRKRGRLGGFVRRLANRSPRPRTPKARRAESPSITYGQKLDNVSHPTSTASSRHKAPSLPRGVFWPKDLLAEGFANVRILVFGYISDRRALKNNIYTLSIELLSRLADKRVDHYPTRPIIFICHGLGGILTKFALKISQNASGAREHLKTIRQSRRAIIFFGTPHAGSQFASLGELLARIGGLFAVTNTTLLAALNAETITADGDHRPYGPPSKYPSCSTDRSSTDQYFLKVVPLASAEISSQWAENRSMVANHTDICKFESEEDAKYQDLKAVLKSTSARSPKAPQIGTIREARLPVRNKLDVSEAAIVKHFRSLSSMDIDQHFFEVQSVDGKSFQWIREHRHFIATLDGHSSTNTANYR
ncbi:hypothetical protein AJ80_04209 [Polytolypa hystricis UAMH7299]|uniref:DUF676 domain-containing protein n=1 Tax=Polytolypa hystricis (strain UAMH7299) TaxID=1447883 RepID=A0A2B7YDJ5_POLH7|nr:hypothetical protein AJ80_04209 [Polytolypa hystricis UAMH7299]